MRQFVSILCNVLGILLIAAVVLVCLPLTVPRLMGYDVYAIVSGSMEPEIPTGSLVYAKGTEPEAGEPGDVIVFYGGVDADAVITHRVVENDGSGKRFITKGDANEGNDVTPIPYEQLLGRVAYTVPVLGLFLPAVSTLAGKVSLLALLAGAVVLRLAGDRLRREEKPARPSRET